VDIAAAVQAVIDQLTAAQIRAVADDRDLNPPAVVVRAPAVEWRFRNGDWSATWTAHAVAEDKGITEALKTLGPLVEQVRVALGGVVTDARPVDVQSPDGGGTLPAYELTWTARINSGGTS
jgi:hypothetical protein